MKQRLNLKELSKSVDFSAERYFVLRYRLFESSHFARTTFDYESYSLLSYQTELNRLRIELFRLQRSMENLRLPALEVVGLTKVSEDISRLAGQVEQLTQKVQAVVSIEPIKSSLRGLLDVVDSCDRAIKLAREKNSASEGVIIGIEAIRRQLVTRLASLGITPIEVRVGDKFNPEIHEALSTVRDRNKPDGTIEEILLAGYNLHQIPLRPAQVVVVKND